VEIRDLSHDEKIALVALVRLLVSSDPDVAKYPVPRVW